MIEDVKKFKQRPEISEMKLGILGIKEPSLDADIPAKQRSSNQETAPTPLDQLVEKDVEERLFGEQFTLVNKHYQNNLENIQQINQIQVEGVQVDFLQQSESEEDED